MADLQDRLKTSQASFEVQPRVFYEEFKNMRALCTGRHPGRQWRGTLGGHFRPISPTPRRPRSPCAERGALLTTPGQTAPSPGRRQPSRMPRKAKDQYSIATVRDHRYSHRPPAERGRTKLHALLPVAEVALAAANAVRERTAAERNWPPILNRVTDLRLSSLLRVEFHRRFALPTACLVLALVGYPAGPLGQEGRQEHRIRADHRSRVPVLPVLADRMSLGATRQVSLLARRLDGQYCCSSSAGIFLLWRVDRMPIEIGNLARMVERRIAECSRIARRTHRSANGRLRNL